MVITDGSAEHARSLERALAAGPGIAVQLRHPEATGRALLEEARALAALCARFSAPLFVNGRLDVAALVGAHLHLPSRGLRPDEVRPLLGPSRWISVAVHEGDPVLPGADLALVSPVFSPGSKPGDTRPTLGPEGFARIAARLPYPALALGGISVENAPSVDAAGFAVISAVLKAADPAEAARALLAAARAKMGT